MIKVSIIGATGYTGRELVRILHFHPEVKIDSLTAKIDEECLISDVFPSFKGVIDFKCSPFDKEIVKNSELIFLAVPHGVSMKLVKQFLDDKKKVIDLSADYRLNDVNDYEKWYNMKHLYPDILKDAVYGLPEFKRQEIKNSNLIANPGCFPTGILLALLPIMSQDIVSLNKRIIIDSKTGASGAGRRGTLGLNFCEVDNNIKAYKINRHQHIIEIIQQIEELSSLYLKNLIFVPHIASFERGILNTIYVPLSNMVSLDKIREYYLKHYARSEFVKIFDSAENIAIKDVANTNKCHIGLSIDEETSSLIIVSAVDNLLKGAAGQAVQNMNIMYGLDEGLGLVR